MTIPPAARRARPISLSGHDVERRARVSTITNAVYEGYHAGLDI